METSNPMRTAVGYRPEVSQARLSAGDFDNRSGD